MNVLIIGYGSIGKRHYRILSGFNEIKNIDVVTNQRLTAINTFKDLKDIDLNIYSYIVIASVTSEHFHQLKYIDKNTRNKLILVEKPLFSSEEKLDIINNNVFVAYNRRFYPIITKIKNLIDKDKCYYINIITGQYLPFWRPERDYRKTYSASKELGGGVLLDLSHEIDYINYLCGNIDCLSSINSKVSDLEINSDDICCVIGKTKQQTIFNFSIDYISKEFIQRIVVHLQESTLIADLKSMVLKQVFKDETIKVYDFSHFNKDYSFEKMHKDLLFEKNRSSCTYGEGVMVMNKILEIQKANNGF